MSSSVASDRYVFPFFPGVNGHNSQSFVAQSVLRLPSRLKILAVDNRADRMGINLTLLHRPFFGLDVRVSPFDDVNLHVTFRGFGINLEARLCD